MKVGDLVRFKADLLFGDLRERARQALELRNGLIIEQQGPDSLVLWCHTGEALWCRNKDLYLQVRK